MTSPASPQAPTRSYFTTRDSTIFVATSAAQGAWNTEEQHIAPALGLLTHILETDHRSRQEHPFVLARVSFDILGTLAIDSMETGSHVVRHGRTIELAEAVLSQDGRAAVIARGWFLAESDTADVAESALTPMPSPADMAPWKASDIWPGEYVTTIDVLRDEEQPGRARFWMRPTVPLIADAEVSGTARMLGLVDIANGITPLIAPTVMAFPNVDLTAHLFRAPQTDWIGFDTTVSFGPRGHGLTHTALHDEHGPIGTVQQSLTLRR